MNIRERLYTIPDLALAKRLQMMSATQLDDYVELLNSFVEKFPAEETELKNALETGNIKSVIKRLTGIRELLIGIYADKLAEECWERLNSFEQERPERIAAYVSFLLSMLAALSIDIQVAFYREETEETEEASDVNPESPQNPADGAAAVKNILAVDDDTYSLNTFKAALKDVSCKVIGVTSGAGALNILNNLKPDLFVLDIEMPEMNGIELAHELKKLGHNAPIVFITGNATRDYVLKCMQAGASEFIVKPISPLNVVSRIEKYL